VLVLVQGKLSAVCAPYRYAENSCAVGFIHNHICEIRSSCALSSASFRGMLTFKLCGVMTSAFMDVPALTGLNLYLGGMSHDCFSALAG
jgi:hypothetical protein